MKNRLYDSNNRAVINEFGVVRQVTNYYPFGGVFSTTAYNHGDDLQPYKYNGKELDRTHGLDWYDYGARNYDAFLPMFTSIDPLCEKYYLCDMINSCFFMINKCIRNNMRILLLIIVLFFLHGLCACARKSFDDKSGI